MAAIVRIKRSNVTGNPSTLAAGELAYSGLLDTGSNGGDRLYIGMGTETNGNAANHVVIGGKFFTDSITSATHLSTPDTLVKRDSSGGFRAGTINATLIGNASTASTWEFNRTLSLSGDGTASLLVNGSDDVDGIFTLANVNTDVGTFGASSGIPVITVNAKGLITAVSIADVSTTLSIAGNTGTDTVNLLSDTVTFEGGTGVNTTVTNNKVTFAIGQPVNTNSDVTFNDVTVNGIFRSNDVTAANISIDGNASITGDLTVLGTTTTINSTTVSVGDKNIELAKDAVSAVMADGGGITLKGPATPATLLYTSNNDSWNFNKDLVVRNVTAELVGNAATATAWKTARNLSLTGDASATLTNVDGTSNVQASITFANVNGNPGTFGDDVTVPSITVNAKGLITNILHTAIPIATSVLNGLASFDSAQFSVTNGLASLVRIDGGTY